MFYILVCLCCLCLLWRMTSSKKQCPELPGKLPLIGHGHRFLGDSTAMFNNVVAKMTEESLERGGVAKVYLGPAEMYYITDPEDSLEVANVCLEKHYIYGFMKFVIVNGLINADVPTWINHRKLLNSAFSQHVLDSFIGMFNTQSHKLVEQFANGIGKPFDHENILRTISLETICSTAIGVDVDEFGNFKKEYLPRFEEALLIYNQRTRQFWLHNDFIYNISSLKKKQDEVQKDLHSLTNLVINKKKTERLYAHTERQSGKFKPFMDLILELNGANNSFTEEEILGETNTIIAAGHETTASTLTFALTLLGSNAEVQEKAYKELLEVLGNSNTNVGKEVLSKLTYLEAILKETLRLYPSVPVIARQLDTDIQLKNITLKANTGCLISIYGVNRHNMWGPDANTFRPERWFESESLPDPKYYAPFGLGRRACIGKVYAMMSMKIMLAKVLQTYRISSDASKMIIQMETTIRPASGHFITLEQRKI